MSDEDTPLKLEVTAEQIKNFVAEAILHQLDDVTKEAMIQNALTHLVTKPQGRYGEKVRAPLEEAYNRAVSVAAGELVRELVNGEFKEQVEGVVREALTRVFTENKEQLINGIAHSMERAMYSLQD